MNLMVDSKMGPFEQTIRKIVTIDEGVNLCTKGTQINRQRVIFDQLVKIVGS